MLWLLEYHKDAAVLHYLHMPPAPSNVHQPASDCPAACFPLLLYIPLVSPSLPMTTLNPRTLSELRSEMESRDAERYRNAMFNINKAKGDVLGQPWRLCRREHLMALSGCKDMLSSVSSYSTTLLQLHQQQPVCAQAAVSAAIYCQAGCCGLMHQQLAAVSKSTCCCREGSLTGAALFAQ